MKRLLYLLLGLLLCHSCDSEKRYAELVVQNGDENFLEIISSVNDIILWDNKRDTVSVNEGTNFIFSKEIDAPEYVEIKIGTRFVNGLLFPGQKTELVNDDSTVYFIGKNAEGLTFLNELNRPPRPYYLGIKDVIDFEKDSTSVMIKEKIGSRKRDELEKLGSLYENHKIDKAFHKTAKAEIEYFYALRTLQIIKYRQAGNTPIGKDLMKLFDETVKNYPLDIDFKPSSWSEYAKQILLYSPLTYKISNGLVRVDSLSQPYNTDSYHRNNCDLIFANSDSELVEKVAANYLYEAAVQNKNHCCPVNPEFS